MTNAIGSDGLGVKVCEALGLNPNLVQRLVLDFDACSGGPLPVYVQMIGSDKLLDIQWDFEGIDIVFIDGKSKSDKPFGEPVSTLDERIAEL